MPVGEGSLSGRTVLVTGGNRGIGLGLAQGVAAAGANVVIWGRDEAANAAAVDALVEHEINAWSVTCDVGDREAVGSAFAESVRLAGSIHAVFANAAVASRYLPFHEQTDEDWQRTLQVDLYGVVWTFREAVRHMLAHGEGGALVGVASLAAMVGQRYYSPYSASKAAVVALTQTIAVEYARKGIRANALLPGWIDTDMTAGAGDTLRDQVSRRTPVGRFGVPEDFAGAAVFLADPTQTFHTGESIVLDGGYLKI